ncbi:MAG: hypothetical protein DRP84_05770 [Spirochaetes bacterium]|nr:MAG: hypothetical protein DRP84_05770 [Spirochaetota bacterium]
MAKYGRIDKLNGEKSNKTIYNREIFSLLFKYIFRYKRYLIYAILFVAVITPINLIIPYFFKNVIDNVVFKKGYLYKNSYEVSHLISMKEINLLLKKARFLVGDKYFIPSSSLRYLSKKEKTQLGEKGIISKDEFVLIEKPVLNDEIKLRFSELIRNKKLYLYPNNIYLLNINSLSNFKVSELLKIRQKDLKRLEIFIAVIFLLLIIQFFSSYLQILSLMKLSQYAMRDLRKDLFAHIMSLKVSYFDKTPVGRLISRATNDVETLNEFFSSVMVTLLQDILIMLGIAVMMFLVDLKLAMIVIAAVPFMIGLLVLFRMKARKVYLLIRTKISSLNSFLNETISGIRIIKIFSAEDKNYSKFKKHNLSLFDAQIKQLYVMAIFRPLISFLRWITIAFIVYWGAKGIVQGKVSYGILVMFIAYIERFFSPLNEISEKFDIMQSAAAASEKILSVLKESDTERLETDNFNSIKIQSITSNNNYDKNHSDSGALLYSDSSKKLKGRIEVKDLYFSYRSDEWVLRDISFSVEPGQTLAIVGRTGVGKTTLINLIMGFYIPQKGEILIDGMRIDKIPLNILRRNIVSVMQDPYLFSRTIKENITMGLEYDEKRFFEAIETVGLREFMEKRNYNENEMVMERGATFSAGERQLISFARALYVNPSILILDEATSSIDSETEQLIQNALEKLVRERTSIVIAHRLSTVKKANKILVIDDGKVVESGTHSQLIENRGLYYRLYSLQFAY